MHGMLMRAANDYGSLYFFAAFANGVLFDTHIFNLARYCGIVEVWLLEVDARL
jgi:hypothetical protein